MYLKLIYPKFCALRNYARTQKLWGADGVRDLVILSFGAIVMALIYSGVIWMLARINADPSLFMLPPQLPIGVVFFALFVMLVLSNLVSAVGGLYLGHDLDLVLASPIKPYQFFTGKLAYITLSSSWTSMIFILPLILGFGHAYNASAFFYFISAAALVPYFLIPALLSIIVGTLFVRFMPANRLKYLLIIVAALLLMSVWFGIDLLKIGVTSSYDRGQLIKIISVISLANVPYLPSAWLASILQSALQGGGGDSWIYLSLLYSLTGFLVGAAYLVLQLFHFETYSGAKYVSTREISRVSPRKGIISVLTRPLKPWIGAIVKKEILLFFREITSILQIVLLSGISLIYIANLKVFGGTSDLSAAVKVWWNSFFFVSNWCIGAFVTTGVCTRFVFPSVSLEGRSFWILKTSPHKVSDVMRAKIYTWYLPIACVSSAILGAGSRAVDAPTSVIVVNMLSGFSLSVGLVGLAVGLGARFSNFDWEHSSQLAASFGSLVFMLSAIMLIVVNLVVIWAVVFTNSEMFFEAATFTVEQIAAGVVGLSVTTLMNVTVGRLALRGGVGAVERAYR